MSKLLAKERLALLDRALAWLHLFCGLGVLGVGLREAAEAARRVTPRPSWGTFASMCDSLLLGFGLLLTAASVLHVARAPLGRRARMVVSAIGQLGATIVFAAWVHDRFGETAAVVWIVSAVDLGVTWIASDAFDERGSMRSIRR